MSVVVSIEDVGACRKQLKVEVPAAAVAAEMRRVVDDYRRKARVSGFRKGKVPVELVRRRFGKEIEREVVDRLIPRYWRQAEAEQELDTLLPPSVEAVDFNAGESLTFTAVVETRPQVEIGPMDDVELPELAVDPTPDEIDEAIEDLRRQGADWVQAERPAARGDRVRGELEPLDAEGEAAARPVDFEIGHEQIWEELSLAATGAAAGQQIELTRRDQPDGPERRYRLRVEAVEERSLPELDDEFARRVGQFDDVAAMRDAVETRLRALKGEERMRRRERALLDELRRRHPLALPEGVVQQDVENALRAYAEQLANRGIDLEKADIDWQALAERERPQAEKRVHARLLLDAAAAQQGVEVSEAEFEQVLAQLARAEGRSAQAVRQALDGSGRLGDLRARLRRDKLLRRLLGEAAPEDDGDDSEEAAEASGNAD